jgi:hypothetical protein
MEPLLIYRNSVINLNDISKIEEIEENEIIFHYFVIDFLKSYLKINKNDDEEYFRKIQNLIENDLFPDFFLKISDKVLVNLYSSDNIILSNEIFKIKILSDRTFQEILINEKKMIDSIKNLIDYGCYPSRFLNLGNYFLIDKKNIYNSGYIDNNIFKVHQYYRDKYPYDLINESQLLKIKELVEENNILKDNHILK